MSADQRAGAAYVADRAVMWFSYSTWHPDYDTADFRRVWDDYKARIPIEDVYWARGLQMPKVNKYGMKLPIAPFPARGS